MPLFQYKGYKPDGSSASGTLEADGMQDALSVIKARGIYPKDVREYVQGERSWLFRQHDRALLPYVTRQLATLLGAGVPLVEALRSLSEENRGTWKGLLIDLREKVSGGASLSRAMEGHPGFFPEFFRNMVNAGEQSGSLDAVLAKVADFLEKDSSIRSKVRTALVYPVFMAVVGLVVLSFLFVFVVPKIVKIFESTKAALPIATVILIRISSLFVNYWWLLLILAALAVIGFRRLRLRHRSVLDRLTLRLPTGVMQALYYGRFARTLGFLLDGGLPVLKSLELTAKAVGNIVLEARIMEAAKKVAEGVRLSAALEGFPSVLLQLISTGEKSGSLAAILSRTADSFEEEFERRVQKMLSLLEPSMILLMGLIVGFIVLAILLPLFQLNQLVK